MSKPSVSRDQWESKLKAAKQFMQLRGAQYQRVLIEVAAQHPLVNGRTPNEEFTERLLKAKELYKKYAELGFEVEVYVPGSRHREGQHTDTVSLSQAGLSFLTKQGLPKGTLHGDDLNKRYKGSAGVYNSADECFVTASYFKEGSFGVLVSIVSPVQLARKALNYIWQETLPLFFTTPTQGTYHDWIQEVYDLLPDVRDHDPDWQAADSVFGQLARQQRMP